MTGVLLSILPMVGCTWPASGVHPGYDRRNRKVTSMRRPEVIVVTAAREAW